MFGASWLADRVQLGQRDGRNCPSTLVGDFWQAPPARLHPEVPERWVVGNFRQQRACVLTNRPSVAA